MFDNNTPKSSNDLNIGLKQSLAGNNNFDNENPNNNNTKIATGQIVTSNNEEVHAKCEHLFEDILFRDIINSMGEKNIFKPIDYSEMKNENLEEYNFYEQNISQHYDEQNILKFKEKIYEIFENVCNDFKNKFKISDNYKNDQNLEFDADININNNNKNDLKLKIDKESIQETTKEINVKENSNEFFENNDTDMKLTDQRLRTDQTIESESVMDNMRIAEYIAEEVAENFAYEIEMCQQKITEDLFNKFEEKKKKLKKKHLKEIRRKNIYRFCEIIKNLEHMKKENYFTDFELGITIIMMEKKNQTNHESTKNLIKKMTLTKD